MVTLAPPMANQGANMNAPIPPNVAALDAMLLAIGKWQASPSVRSWQEKLAAIHGYLALAEAWDPRHLAPR